MQSYNKNNEKSSKSDTFIQAAKIERQKIKELANKSDFNIRKINPIEGTDSWDVSIQSGTTILITEIKVRNCKHNQYSTSILEKEKVDEINEEIKKFRELKPELYLIPYFIAFFKDETAYGWEITGEEKITEIMAEKTTVRYGNPNIVPKTVVNFDLKKGKKLC